MVRSLFRYFPLLYKKRAIYRRFDRILLLSHMRANTSLFGHIIGSNPEVEGYYEMHLSYPTKKSLLKQKLEYFCQHDAKPSSKYIFDKVLGLGSFINLSLFDMEKDKILIMIRNPNDSIKSTVALFQKNKPHHVFATFEGASQYYTQRLVQLLDYAKRLEGQYIFMESENITADPDSFLASLSDSLKLKMPLTREYRMFPKTGEQYAGDNSKNISKGYIEQKDRVDLAHDLTSPEINKLYSETLAYLKANALSCH